MAQSLADDLYSELAKVEENKSTQNFKSQKKKKTKTNQDYSERPTSSSNSNAGNSHTERAASLHRNPVGQFQRGNRYWRTQSCDRKVRFQPDQVQINNNIPQGGCRPKRGTNPEDGEWKRVIKKNKQKKVKNVGDEDKLVRKEMNLQMKEVCKGKGISQMLAGTSGLGVAEKKFKGDENKPDVHIYNEVRENEPRKRQHIIGYKELEKLSEEDPYEVIKVLANRTYGFDKLLRQDLRPDLLILVIKLISKLCKIDFDDLKIQLLSSACNYDFLDHLSKHIALIPLEQNKTRKANIGVFLEDLFTFLETVMNLLPSKAAENFENIFMIFQVTLPACERKNKDSFGENTKKRFDQLHTQYNRCVEEMEKKKKTETDNLATFDLAPDDFRDLSLFPTSDDILSEEPAFIRPNIINGAYDNVEHYLDIQFRLLREDFVSPLRDGIAQYINMGDQKNFRKISSVRIYRKVYFVNPKVVKDRLGLIVNFDPDKRFKKVIWEHSKRFMYGSLLLFSRDNFATIIFATVMDRNVKDLKAGNIVVQLSNNSTVSDDMFMDQFVMAESSVYFEPYYHVMKALQELIPTTFPMEDYIVHAIMSDIPPKYLTKEGGEVLDIDGRPVQVLKIESWPTAEMLRLDESQYNAFKASLTKKFVVVQGPPGTGKTFLGLKVANVLLKNAPVWNASKRPILVVCYTNHALDQFLEGLIHVTDKIIRVGGQSKSTVLEGFNLKEQRRAQRKSSRVFHLMRDIRFRMNDYMGAIQRVQSELEIISQHRGIISLSILKEFGISDQHLACFDGGDRFTDKYFIDWLEQGMYDEPAPDLPAAEVIENPLEGLDENGLENEPLKDDEDLHRHLLDDIVDFQLCFQEVIPRIKFALDLNVIQPEVDWIELQLKHLREQRIEDPSLIYKIQELEMIRDDLKFRHDYIKQQLSKEDMLDRRTLRQLQDEKYLWELEPTDRWKLYKYWVERLRLALILELQRLENCFRIEARMFEDAQQINDLEIMRQSLVVGMTTTGAARLQKLLQALKAKIVIVEEAAEVMESHIIVSLTSHCEHLILIGDHQQLRPSPAVYKLARDYNFDISLFERMLKNNMHCEVLKVQHRMRPEIVQLIVPTIYRELKNHNSVLQYEKIRGMLKSVYFITHNHEEEEVEDISSHRNTHEGDFLIELCRYLVLQGYNPSRITILATYSGQMFYIRTVRKRYQMLSEVRITVVDNFQGEENDIILLSLVRSNKDARIGFLKTENRVCVALSRAKMGFYIIGNMDNLVRNNSVWPKINETLKKDDAIGTHLILRCQVHATEFTRVSSAEDFNSSPEGGCRQLCKAELSCGHTCKRVCHVRDREHLDYHCFEPCERIPIKCELKHKCLKTCGDDCGDCMTMVKQTLPCGHTKALYCHVNPEKYKCQEKIEVELPDCGHTVKKPCHMDIQTFPCSHLCEDRLQCGHSCVLTCHKRDDPDHLNYVCNKPCTRENAGCKESHKCQKLCHEECGDCRVKIQRKLPHCEHKAYMFCSFDAEKYLCKKQCQRILPCEHKCPNVCSAECGNCPEKVTKTIEYCGHPLQVKCCETPDRSMCKQPCKKILPCGHPCTGVCAAECTKKCRELVASTVRPACGHGVYIPCYMQNLNLAANSETLLSYCQMPCGSQLQCVHPCAGTCGECRQGRIHKSCKQKCGRVLICGHSCNIPCAEVCPPCNRKCMYRCKHSKCSRPCGQPCINCKEPCDWSCVHQKCKKLCYELCDREPCREPCTELLKCNHPCIGFCGERCPSLCRVCDKEEVTEIFFGNEDDPDARFVFLEDCKHTLEANGLEEWMTQSDGEIKLKTCPKCKTPIAKTQRYMNIVKKVYKDICIVKRRVFGAVREIEMSRDEIADKLEKMEFLKDSKEFSDLYNGLSTELKPIRRGRMNLLSALDTGTFQIKVEILSQLVETYSKAHKQNLATDDHRKILEYLDILLCALKKHEKKISKQQVNDFNMEIQRFHRLCQLYTIRNDAHFKMGHCKPEVIKAYDAAHSIVYSIERFTLTNDAAMKGALQNLNTVLKRAVMITDAERRQIHAAMGFGRGHWFKCPNGHIYAIGECGGAMQRSRCNECGAAIGGGSHQLLSSNSLASEMDGATRPAYPTALRHY